MGTFKENVSANLKRILRDKELSQRDLAKIVEVSEPTVHSWVTGDKAPRAEQFDKIKERLGISPAQIIADPAGEDDALVTFLKDQLNSRGYNTFKKSPPKRP